MDEKLIALSLLFLCSIPYMSASAWPDGYIYSPYATFPVDYDYRYNYGINDWIADNVLSALYSNNTFQWEWLRALKLMYFIGTESISNPNVDMIIEGKSVKGENYRDFFAVHVRFVGNDSIIYVDGIDHVYDVIDRFKHALLNESYYLAAYYLGQIVAYMALFGYYPVYIIDGNPYRDSEYDYSSVIYKSVSFTNLSLYYNINITDIGYDSVNDTINNIAKGTLLSNYNRSALSIDWLVSLRPYPDPLPYDEWISKPNTSKVYEFYRFHRNLFSNIIYHTASLCKFLVDNTGFNGTIITEVNYNRHDVNDRVIVIISSIVVGIVFSGVLYVYRDKIKKAAIRGREPLNRVRKVKKVKLRKKRSG